MKKLLQNLRDRIEDGLRGVCGRMTRERRIITIVVLITVFAVVNLWVTFRAIYLIGHEDKPIELIEITPLDVPDFDLGGEQYPTELERGFNELFKQQPKPEQNDTISIEGQPEP